jgi:hypothetical protein
MRIIACVLLLASSSAALLLRQNSSSPTEVHRLYLEDQEDRGAGADGRESLPWAEMEPRDRSRRERVHELLVASALKTGEDFHDAAFIYQHGQTSKDYLLAHVLAIVAIQKGDAKSLWISAATLDRYLFSIDQPQIFGTQYHSKKDSPVTQEPYDRELVPDALRLTVCVPSLDQQKKNLLEFNADRYPSGILPAGCTR